MRVSNLLAGAALLATPLPYVAEAMARGAIEDEVARCRDGTRACGGIDELALDVGGLHVRSAWKHTRGFVVGADAIEVRPTWHGLLVHVDGLSIAKADVVESEPVRDVSASSADDPPVEPAIAPTIDTKGIPVHVVAKGTHAIEERGVTLQVHDPVLEIDREGKVAASFDADVRRGPLWAASAGRLRARPVAGFGTWALQGRVVVAQGMPLRVDATLSRSQLELELADDDGGSLRVEASPSPLRGSVQASAFKPSMLGTLSSGETAGVHWDLGDAVFDGAVSVARDDGWRVEVPTLFVSGAVLEHPAIARDPVTIGSLIVAGGGSLRNANDFAAKLSVEHDGVGVDLDARRDATALAVTARMPTLPCQALVDGVPEGMAGALRGTRLVGEIAGALDLEVRFAELPAWEERLALDPENPGAPPGLLDIDFPFLEQCDVVGDPGDIDFDALEGAYRHQFIDGTGRRRTRVMASGAPGFVPLWRVPLIAGAFIALEDTGFKKHDGFDRAQLGNALWHNFRVGGISRGASTISQQTARNLFLGVDRSIGRKLQEALLTARLEEELSKTRILELYLNVIELGPGVHGVEDAAQYHFGKSAWQLDVVQSIHLAMLAPAPHRYSERWKSGVVDEAWAQAIRDHAKRLWFHGVITEEQMLIAQWDDLDLVPR